MLRVFAELKCLNSGLDTFAKNKTELEKQDIPSIQNGLILKTTNLKPKVSCRAGIRAPAYHFLIDGMAKSPKQEPRTVYPPGWGVISMQ